MPRRRRWGNATAQAARWLAVACRRPSRALQASSVPPLACVAQLLTLLTRAGALVDGAVDLAAPSSLPPQPPPPAVAHAPLVRAR